MDINKLLDIARETCSASSDNALAIRLHVSRQRVSAWRKGTNYPDAVACARISELTGVPLVKVIGLVGEARALSKAEKAVWHRLASAAALACVLLAPAAASHATGHFVVNPQFVYYVTALAALVNYLRCNPRHEPARQAHGYLLAL